jgi:RimJ/RimL family protein N-acetyltransferase
MQESCISFRPAAQEDLSELLAFPQSQEELFYFFPSATHPLTLNQLQKQLSKRHQSTIMLKDNKVIGFANFYNVKNRNIAFIGNVIVKAEERRKGYAKQLLLHMIKLGFNELKLKEIHISCFNQNTKALLFYHQLGFKPYAWEIRKDYNQAEVIMLHLRLKNSCL